MELKPGSRWKSVVCTSEVVVVRAPGSPVVLECGGAAMVAKDAPVSTDAAIREDRAGGTLVGKRYWNEAAGIEVLGSKAGKGSLSVNGVPLDLKEAKALPASD